MKVLQEFIKKVNKIDFLFPNDFNQLMNDEYYDYEKFEWFLYHVFRLDKNEVDKVSQKNKGDGGVDLIITLPLENGAQKRIGIQAKYWKNRVGTQPMNQLASAKSRHGLTDLWLITTSDLTDDALKIADLKDIKILRKEDVIKLIDTVKEIHNRNLLENGESNIKFLNQNQTKEIDPKMQKDNVESLMELELITKLKELRKQISKRCKLFPVYQVFNNEMLSEIIKMKPISLEELANLKGFGPKKVELFGIDIIEFVKQHLIKEDKTEFDDELYDFLLTERIKMQNTIIWLKMKYIII
jgi:hypothetical protein